LGAVLHSVGDGKVQTAFAKNLLTGFDVGAFHSNDDGDLQMQFLGGRNDASGENVAAQDSAKNIDEDGFDFRIAHQNAESVLDLFGGRDRKSVEYGEGVEEGA